MWLVDPALGLSQKLSGTVAVLEITFEGLLERGSLLSAGYKDDHATQADVPAVPMLRAGRDAREIRPSGELPTSFTKKCYNHLGNNRGGYPR